MHRKCIVLLIQFTEMSAEEMQAEMLLDMEVGQETNTPPSAQPQLELATVISLGTSQTTPEAGNQANGTSNSAGNTSTSTSSSGNIGLGPGTVATGGRGRGGGRERGRGRQRRRGQFTISFRKAKGQFIYRKYT